jgi:phenylpropionate dioxygenase-like ring-hydroxylating dioxygenase large terminal subunit
MTYDPGRKQERWSLMREVSMHGQISSDGLKQTNFTVSAGLGTGPVPLDPYRSASFYEAERERVFGRAWLMLARREEIASPGDFVVKSIPSCGVSAIITHGKDGRIRAFHNSCSHRGSEVVAAHHGNRALFVCPYHNWTYANDGRLVGIPDEASFFGIDKSNCGLSPIACDLWEGWIFVNLQPEPEVPLATFLGSFAQHLTGIQYLAADNPVILTADLDANWKVVADAFIETYHIPVIHPRTIGTTFSSKLNPCARLLGAQLYGSHRAVSMYGNPNYVADPRNHVERLATTAAGSVIAAATREGAGDFLAHPSVNPTRSGNWSMDVNHLFPHTHIDCGPGGFWTHQFWPVSPNRSRYEARFYVPKAQTIRERFQQELYIGRVVEVVLEDLSNVARTQRGIDSSGKKFMQLQDSEVGIRHSLEQIIKWINAETVVEALA